jgi:hypothetical protein
MTARRKAKDRGVSIESRKTTINLDPALKRRAKLYALQTGRGLQDLIAEGLRLVLARRTGGR